MIRKFLYAVMVVIIVGWVAFCVYSFRSFSEVSSDYGKATYRYRWGKPFDVRVDFNQDGRFDYRARVPGVFGAGIIPLESWQDPRFEGFYRYHVIYSGGEVTVVEIDKNGDGVFDQQLENGEAREFAARELKRK